ncbi:hypothetical protein GCM10025298_00370 [Natronobiforma cellulositropha]
MSRSTDVDLATVTLEGIDDGETTVDVTLDRIEDDSGTSISPEIIPTSLTVKPENWADETDSDNWTDEDGSSNWSGELEFDGDTYTPMDLNGDGLHRDITGNGEVASHDVIVFFETMDDPLITGNVEKFDFAGTGTIGFADVMALFESL